MSFPIESGAFCAAIPANDAKLPALRHTTSAVKMAPRPDAVEPQRDPWADVKTVLEVGLAIVRIVEIAILFA